MGIFSSIETLQVLKEKPLVPLFYNEDLDVCKSLITACYKGGVRVIEFTNRGEKAIDVFRELLEWSQTHFPKLILGIGTIKSVEMAEKFIAIGANFIVTPVLDIEVGDSCKKNNVPWIPGCGTLTEMFTAHKNGAALVKAFPINALGGATYIKSVLAPCPELKIMPSGGIKATQQDVKQYLDAGVYCVGVGSSLFVKEGNEYDYNKISENCRNLLNI